MKTIVSSFPTSRLRRVREHAWCRDLVAETQLSVKDFILPLFIRDATTDPVIPAMPGVLRYSLEELVPFCQTVYDLGIRAIALFPHTPHHLKCEEGKEALNSNNLACQATRLLKKTRPELGVIVDVALDPYTTHGHDGILRDNHIANDETLEILAQMALTLAQAGVDIVAPSDMMDGRVGAIRQALDREGYQKTSILAYTAKYASALYGPFRDAVGSKGCLGKADKKSYQMDPANAREALREGAQDLWEGADMLMVKPGLPYLDIIYRLKETFSLPIFAYQVSGEYSSLKAAAQNGWLDYEAVLMETFISLKRAGASAILSYAALEAAKILKEDYT